MIGSAILRWECV